MIRLRHSFFFFLYKSQTTRQTNSFCPLNVSPRLSFPPAAIYLCKRTMQNKARLELADYEAVSTQSLCFQRMPGSSRSDAIIARRP